MSEQRVRLIDQLIQWAADELYEGKTPERVAGLLQILAGQEIGVQEARTRIAQKFGRGKFATAVEKCFWTSEEREAAETAAAAAAISETPPKPEMTSDPDPPAERPVTVEASAAATTLSATPAKPDATAETTSATPGDGAGERRAKSPEVRVAVEGEVDQPPASEVMELAVDAGAGDARKSVKVTMPSPEPVATVAAETPATTTAVTPMDVDASEKRRSESTELTVDTVSASAVAPKNPSDPLPPGLKIPRRPRTIVDVRTREEGQGAVTGSSTAAVSESSSDRRREKRRHPTAAPRRESRHGTSPDRKSSSSRHSRHSSSDRSRRARSRGHSSSKPSSSRTRERSSGASSKRRRKSASPRSTGGAHERPREGRSTKDAGRAKGRRATPERPDRKSHSGGSAKPRKSGTSDSGRPRTGAVDKKTPEKRAPRRTPRKTGGASGKPASQESALKRAVTSAVSAAEAFTTAIVTCAALTLATTLSTVTTTTTAGSESRRHTGKPASKRASKSREMSGATLPPSVPVLPAIARLRRPTMSATVSRAVAGVVHATGTAFSTHAIAPTEDKTTAEPAETVEPADSSRMYRRRMDFPPGIVTREMLKHALDTDRNGGYVDYISPQDCHDPLERRVLGDFVILSRQMPFRRQYLKRGEPDTEDVWRTIWRDDFTHWELNRADFRALARMDGACHHLELVLSGKKRWATVHAACGHISSWIDFHVFCRTCQICAEGKLCCTGSRSLCAKGKAHWTTNQKFCEPITESRALTLEYIRDRGRRLQVQWLGTEKSLQFSVVRRLAYAIGYGATDLEPELKRMLEIAPDAATLQEIVHELRELALQERVEGQQPMSCVKVVPLYACGRKGYMEQMRRIVGPLPSVSQMLEDYTPEAALEAKLLAASLGRPNVPPPSEPADTTPVFPGPSTAPLPDPDLDSPALPSLPTLDFTAMAAALGGESGDATLGGSHSAPASTRLPATVGDPAGKALLVSAQHLRDVFTATPSAAPFTEEPQHRPLRVASAPPFQGTLDAGLSSPDPIVDMRTSRLSTDIGASDWERTSYEGSHTGTARSQPYSTIPSVDDHLTVQYRPDRKDHTSRL